MDWINTDRLGKFEEMAMELAVFVGQSCDCPFPPSSITTPRFTCHPPHVQHVTYRASVAVSMGQLSREGLVSALEEWPRTHRSILIQGERLSVEEQCPVIIQSLEEEEECEIHTPPPTTPPATVALTTFLIGMGSTVVVTMALMSSMSGTGEVW